MSGRSPDTGPARPDGDAGFEREDMRARSAALFGLIVGAVVAIGVLGAWAAVATLDAARDVPSAGATAGPAEGGDAPGDPRPSWPEPRLRAAPAAERAALDAWEDERLGAWEWVDREADVARIPVERARTIVLERGLLPTRSAGERAP